MAEPRQIVLAGFIVSLFITVSATADPIRPLAIDEGLVADGGSISIYFAGSEAGYDSELFLADPDSQGPFFPNHSTSIGDSVDLGVFAAGTPLVFRLHVLTTGDDFFTGPASGNPDSLVHAHVTSWAPSAAIPVSGVKVGFEDLFGNGDGDFNDFTFVVSSTPATPEPASLLLLGTGAIGMATSSWRRRKHALRPGA